MSGVESGNSPSRRLVAAVGDLVGARAGLVAALGLLGDDLHASLLVGGNADGLAQKLATTKP
jgi:hypothetical protein